METAGECGEAVDVTAADTPANLSSLLLDLTRVGLSDLRTLRTPLLDDAIRWTIAEAKLGRFGDSIQGQRD
jgi:hypothetical protein